MVGVVEASSIFGDMTHETVRQSESASSFVDWHRPRTAKQHYRPPQSAPTPEDELTAQIRTLTSKLQALQQAHIEVGSIAAGSHRSGKTAPTGAPPPTTSPEQQTFDSCAQYAAEASRVRSSGRLPFSSDYCKISR